MSDTTSNTVEIRCWVKRGKMIVNTDALDHDDPDHPYNQLLAQGVIPEEFGLKHPLGELYKDLTRAQLIAKIVELEKENTILNRASLMWR